MTLIVADNSPLNLIIRLGKQDILPKLFAQVLIPPEVAVEMSHPKAPQIVREFIKAPPSWLVIRIPNSLLPLPDLDPGESAAISLAVELHAILMIDERDGREAALAQGVQIIGAVGILERAANDGLIEDLDAVYAQIKALRFHISKTVLSESLLRHSAFKQRRT